MLIAILIFCKTLLALDIYQKLHFIERKIELASNLEYINARNRFIQGTTQKNIFNFSYPLQDVHLFYIKLFPYPQQQLLVCKKSNNTILIINQIGVIVAEYQHSSNIVLQDFYNNQDDYYIAIYDEKNYMNLFNLTITINHISQQPQEDYRLVDKDGFYYEFQLKYDSQFQLNTTITSFLINQGRNQRVYLIGDQDGVVSYYHQNGTVKTKNVVSTYPIIQLIRRHPHILYFTKQKVGFLNSISLTSVSPKCDVPASQILQVYQENIYGQSMYLLLENKDVLVYQLKSGKHQECTISYKIPLQDQAKQIKVVNQYLLAYNSSLQIYNTTLYKAFYQDEMLLFNSIDDKQFEFDYYNVRTQKIGAFSNSAYEIMIINNRTIIRQFELFHHPMQVNSSFSIMESFRFPMILIAIFIVFIFQFWQKKSKNSSDGDELSMETKKKIDDMVKQYSKIDNPD